MIKLNRRRFVQAAGAALALPLLPELSAQAQAGAFPKRLVIFHVPEGMEPDTWWPTAPGAGYSFPSSGSLSPLDALRSDITVVKGINNESAWPKFNQDCYHNFGMTHILTGGPDSPSIQYGGKSYAGGISIDRFLGNAIKGPAAFASYELGVQVGGSDNQRKISFDGKDQGREAVNNPFTVFTQLSGQASGTAAVDQQKYLARKKSMLDVLRGEIDSVRCKLGAESKSKLDAHVQSIRSVEDQLTALAQAGGNFSKLVSVASSWNNGNNHGDMVKYPDVGKLQMDMLVAALQTDLLRVGTLQWSNTVSRVSFPWLNLSIKGDHHDAISHNESTEAATCRTQICTWYAEQFKYFIEKLKSVPEGSGTLLDNTVVVYISEMSIGNSHWPKDLPIMLAGGAGKSIVEGQYFEFLEEKRHSLNDLWLTICHALGVPISSFGEAAFSKGPITELLL